MAFVFVYENEREKYATRDDVFVERASVGLD
jgi:hypothetical protein